MGRIQERGEGIPEGGISDIQNRGMETCIAFDKGKGTGGRQEIDVSPAPYTFSNSEWEPKLRDIH